MGSNKKKQVSQKCNRIGEIKLNNQGCQMEIVEYIDCCNIIVRFKDKYEAEVHAAYKEFKNGGIRNPYYPSVYGVGISGRKYPTKINGKHTKEYETWRGMLRRCYDEKHKKINPTYKGVSCCDEWLLFENFYEWLHSQENFDKWLNGNGCAIDKDIIIKNNKTYSPETCCLVPQNVNSLFVKKDINRGDLPIGVSRHGDKFQSWCCNPFACKQEFLGTYETCEKAFYSYKFRKEVLIKQVAQEEYNKGNITKRCYDAMMNYEVEITD